MHKGIIKVPIIQVTRVIYALLKIFGFQRFHDYLETKGEIMKTQRKAFMARGFISLFLCGIIVFWGSQIFGQEWTAEQKEVWEVVVADFEKFKQGDAEGILASRHEDVLIWWGDKPIPYDKKTVEYNYRNWFSYDIPTKWELEPLAIKVIGNVASVFFTYKWSGNILSGSDRDLETWIKQDGKWLMINSFNASCDKLPPCK